MAAGTPTTNDMYQLALSTAFQARVQATMVEWCTQIASEGWSVPFHRERAQWAAQVLANPQLWQAQYVPAYSMVAAVNGTVIADATQSATNYTALTSANRDAQSALVTDTDLSNAIFAAGNAFFRTPS